MQPNYPKFEPGQEVRSVFGESGWLSPPSWAAKSSSRADQIGFTRRS